MCSSGSSAPAPDPNIGIAALKNSKIAEDTLNWYKKMYEENLPRQAAADDMAQKLYKQQFDMAEHNKGRADQQWNYWQDTYQPVERQTVMDSMGSRYLGDSDRALLASIVSGTSNLSGGELTSEMDRISRAAAEGAATQAVTSSQALANSSYAQQARNLSRSGMDPARMAAAAAGLAQNQTLTNVTAANVARQGVSDQQAGLRTGVANFGRNMPNTAGQAFGLATQAGNSAGQNGMIGNNYNASQNAMMGGAFTSAANTNASVMSGLNQQYGNQIAAYGQQQQAEGQSAAGLGSLVGMAAIAI